MIIFDKSICRDKDAALSREWLETNGIGGFASGTISARNTRRYHGILTAATRPPLGRMTMIAKFEETLVFGDQRFELSTDIFPGCITPDGYKLITSFRLEPFPIWTYEAGGAVLEKRIFMVYGENATVCRWKILSGGEKASLELRPLVACVDYHSLQHEQPIDADHTSAGRVIEYRPYEADPPMYFVHNAESVENVGEWYRNFEYPIEQERGFDYHEDLFQPFVMRFDLSKGADVVVSIDNRSLAAADTLEQAEMSRRAELIESSKLDGEFAQTLVLAADQFIVKRGSGHTVIAGYPWFSDWGRDTMIALPGLTLATGRPEIARNIILEFSKHISEGMLPNRFPDAGETPEYNTVDATLWYFEAIRAYAEKTGDFDLVEEHLSKARRHHRLASARHAIQHPRRYRRPFYAGSPTSS